ncbi:MAG: hypothetical protein ACOC92_02050, partial [bacterium]
PGDGRGRRPPSREGGGRGGRGVPAGAAQGPGGNPAAPGGVASGAQGGDPAGSGRTEAGSRVPSLEDELLNRLLDPGADLPPVERLPPEEVFFDPVARNIYRTLHALYKRDGEGPGVRALVEALGSDGEAVARVARYRNAHAQPAGARRMGLGECIERLARRWTKERLRSLVHEIRDAQRRGDRERLEQLLDEKQRLSHAHHRGIAGRTTPEV